MFTLVLLQLLYVAEQRFVELRIMLFNFRRENGCLNLHLRRHHFKYLHKRGNTLRYTTHEQFKQQTADSQAVIRSGECSPYANIILCAGVTF